MSEPENKFLYLIHFEQRVAHAGHYLGCTDDLKNRLHEHGNTYRGAALMQECRRRGIAWTLAAVWRHGHDKEHKTKQVGGLSKYCPICNPHTATWRNDRLSDETIEQLELGVYYNRYYTPKPAAPRPNAKRRQPKIEEHQTPIDTNVPPMPPLPPDSIPPGRTFTMTTLRLSVADDEDTLPASTERPLL